MSIGWLVRTAPGRRLVRRVSAGRAEELVRRVVPHLPRGGRVIDIGAGTCQVAAGLVARGFAVTAVDLRDWSCEPTVVPQLIDGDRLPFPDDTFAVGLLITVLHHTRTPERVLSDAMRVARRLVVIEDVHAGRPQRMATMAMDSLVNLEVLGHPHSNRSEPEWRATFDGLGLNVIASSTIPFWRFFRSALFVLERSAASPAGDPGSGPRPEAVPEGRLLPQEAMGDPQELEDPVVPSGANVGAEALEGAGLEQLGNR